MRIDTSGNVGIGTSSSLDKLTVAGAIKVTAALNTAAITANSTFIDNNSTARILSYGPDTSTLGTFSVFQARSNNTSGTTALLLDTSANFAIPPSYNHTTASAANVFIRSDGYLQRSTSALKYKQDIRDLESIDIGLLRPVRYKSKCEGDDQTKDHLGIVADEAHESGFTDLVTYGAEGQVEGFQYERLTVVLLKSIQELNAKVEAQAAEIAALKGLA